MLMSAISARTLIAARSFASAPPVIVVTPDGTIKHSTSATSAAQALSACELGFRWLIRSIVPMWSSPVNMLRDFPCEGTLRQQRQTGWWRRRA